MATLWLTLALNVTLLSTWLGIALALSEIVVGTVAQLLIGDILESLAKKPAEDVMTEPVVTIGEERLVIEAVERMISKGVKRLPVVDADGRFLGLISDRGHRGGGLRARQRHRHCP